MSQTVTWSDRPQRGLASLVMVVVLAASLAGCGGSSTGSDDKDRIVEGVNLTELFKAPTDAERDSVLANWALHSNPATDVEVQYQTTLSLGASAATLRVVSHTVNGVMHYGAIVSPNVAEPGSLPLVLYLHGGDNGVDVSELLTVLPYALESEQDDYVYVVPSFRAEELRYAGATYTSAGDASPWDRDVDDALSLTSVALAITPAADPERIGTVGFSRGACVGMLMGIRDSRIDLVIEFFGPTDFFSPFTEEIFVDALNDELRDLPGLSILNANIIQPLKTGMLTPSQARQEMLRRSPVYFVDMLPPTQAHHGNSDDVVPVTEAHRLRQAFIDEGLGSPDQTVYFYTLGEHDVTTLFGSFQRARGFLGRLKTPPTTIAKLGITHD